MQRAALLRLRPLHSIRDQLPNLLLKSLALLPVILHLFLIIVLYNVDGYWDKMIAALETMQSAGFVRGGVGNFFLVADSVDKLKSILENI